MSNPVIQFIVIALLAGIGLWAIQQFPADATIVKFIRVAVIVVLAVMLLNVILVLLFGKPLAGYLGAG